MFSFYRKDTIAWLIMSCWSWKKLSKHANHKDVQAKNIQENIHISSGFECLTWFHIRSVVINSLYKNYTVNNFVTLKKKKGFDVNNY